MKIRLDTNLLMVILVIFAVCMYYRVTLPSPIVFGDEGWYGGISRYIATSGIFPKFDPLQETAILHTPLLKQPLWFLQDAWAWLAGGELAIKLLLPLIPALASFMLYLLLRRTAGSVAGLSAAFVLLAMPSVISYGGTLNYVEGSLMLWFISAAYFAFSAFESGRKAHIAAAGIFSGFAAMTDMTGLLIIPLILSLWVLTARKAWKTALTILVIALAVFSPFLSVRPPCAGSPPYLSL